MATETRSADQLPADPAALVAQLNPAALTRRIDQLDAEREALVVLLRAARARERAAKRRGVANAS
jgi:hypothetical protein